MTKDYNTKLILSENPSESKSYLQKNLKKPPKLPKKLTKAALKHKLLPSETPFKKKASQIDE